jgi:hypothetical protein
MEPEDSKGGVGQLLDPQWARWSIGAPAKKGE